MELAGAVVVVTGASRGIGRATTELLLARGAAVLAVGRDEAALASLTGTGVSSLPLDVTAPGASEQIVEAALARHGRLDAVVANAGVGYAGDLVRLPAVRLDELVAVNLLAPLQLARAALPVLHRPGALLFVTSIAGALGVPGESVYSATKAGLETFAETLAAELHGTGIAVGTVLPGVVATDFFRTRGLAYDRRFPRPMPVALAARQVVGALESGRRRTVTPRWLGLPARLHAVAPQLYRSLERRATR